MIDERRAKRALMGWGVGRSFLAEESGAGAAVVLLESAEHLARVADSDVLRPGTVLLAPHSGDRATLPEGVELMGYEGDPAEPAAELTVGEDVFVQNQDYATAEYMSVIGPTLLRVLVPEDFEALLGDLDAARRSGAFPDHLVHPAAQLADRSALGGPTALDGPRTRLHLRRDGSWSVGPLGSALGGLDDGFDALLGAWQSAPGRGAAIPLGEIVPEDVRSAAVDARPWLGHALSIVTALQDLAARGVVSVSVSGFGAALHPAFAGERPSSAAPDAATPVVAWTDDAAFLHMPARNRTFRLDRPVAAAFEAVLATSGPEEAELYAPAELVRAAAARLDQEASPAGAPA